MQQIPSTHPVMPERFEDFADVINPDRGRSRAGAPHPEGRMDTTMAQLVMRRRL